MRYHRKLLMVFLSLIATPLILFLSTANSLYLKNQVFFGYQAHVLIPFGILFLVFLGVGCGLYWFARYRVGEYLLMLYYFSGISFIIYNSLRNARIVFLETAWGVLLSVILLILIVVLAVRKIGLNRLRSFFATVSICLLVFEAISFSTRVRTSFNPNPTAAQEVINVGAGKESPNIYLLILDEFQTDMFECTLSDEVKARLGGFIYFPENTTAYGRTGMSVPSIFSGRTYDLGFTQNEYKIKSVSSQLSILYWLKQNGYKTYAYIRGAEDKPLDMSLFDFVSLSETLRKQSTLSEHRNASSAFEDLWIYKNMPLCVSIRLMGSKRLKEVQAHNFLPENANITSLRSFQQYLKEETRLSPINRFTYIYLLLPHFPYIFKEDCSYYPDLRETTSVSQSACATKIITDFIEVLKTSGTFESSLIVICADHGAGFQAGKQPLDNVTQGTHSPEYSMARARALLLVKPVNTSSAQELIISDFGSSLIDIAPTISCSVLPNIPLKFEGVPLGNIIPPAESRKKYYYFYEKGPQGRTDELTEFLIENDCIKRVGTKPVRH